jgi:hypothetical protein
MMVTTTAKNIAGHHPQSNKTSLLVALIKKDCVQLAGMHVQPLLPQQRVLAWLAGQPRSLRAA